MERLDYEIKIVICFDHVTVSQLRISDHQRKFWLFEELFDRIQVLGYLFMHIAQRHDPILSRYARSDVDAPRFYITHFG